MGTSPSQQKQPPTPERAVIRKGKAKTRGQIIGLYGAGGTGKTEAVSLLDGLGCPVLFADCEGGTEFMDVARAEINSYVELRGLLQDTELLKPYKAICIDSMTAAEEHAEEHVVQYVPHEKGYPIERIEDYGWGKGYRHIFDTMMNVLADCDNLARHGKHIVWIGHEIPTNVKNVAGEDFLQMQPRATQTAQAAFRSRLAEWSDHLIYLKFDATIHDGKATGGGTRTFYSTPMPFWWAKSRTIHDPVPYPKGNPDIWNKLFEREGDVSQQATGPQDGPPIS